ncbi:MAG: porin family protein [Afipia sp.]|nr:porin family protein [Afipia sp.]
MRVWICAVALLAVTSASAEELKRRTFTRPAPAPVFTWTGFYIGGNAGCASRSIKPTSSMIDQDNEPNVTFPMFYTGNAGCFAGAQAGYNYQFMPRWVAGFEVDGQIGSLGGQGTLHEIEPGNDELLGYFSHQTTSFGTVRGRVGYLWDVPNTMGVLTYATAGWAWARTNTSVLAVDVFPNVTSTDTRTLNGYAVGAGAEMAVARNWSVKIEYLFLDFGSTTYSNLFYDDGINTAPLVVNMKIHTFKLGANYHLDWMR